MRFLLALSLVATLSLTACADGEPDTDTVLDNPVPEVSEEMGDAADAAFSPDTAAAMRDAFESEVDTATAGF